MDPLRGTGPRAPAEEGERLLPGAVPDPPPADEPPPNEGVTDPRTAAAWRGAPLAGEQELEQQQTVVLEEEVLMDQMMLLEVLEIFLLLHHLKEKMAALVCLLVHLKPIKVEEEEVLALLDLPPQKELVEMVVRERKIK